MNFVRREINLIDDEILKIYRGFIDKDEYNIVKSIKVYKTQIININFRRIKCGNNRVIISVVDTTTSDKQILKIFEDIIEYDSLAYISFEKHDYLYMFKTNIYSSSYNYGYSECVESFGELEQKDAYLWVLINFIKYQNDDELKKMGLFICRNIKYLSEFNAEMFLQQTDYLGFQELYSKYEYKKLKSSNNNRVIDMMSFLIYCLKCINSSTENIYTSIEIESIGERIISTF